MYKEKRKWKHSRIRSRIIIVTVLVLLLLTLGGVFAKYIYNDGGKGLLSAKEFYFTSNLLTENTAKYVLNSQTTEVSFTLGNNADKLRYSQDDVEYTVTVECKNGGSTPSIVYADSEQVLTGGSVDQTTVTLTGLTMGGTYIVSAVGEAGYQKTLKAEFTVSDKEESVYMHLDTSNDAYVLLTVWTENVKGTLTIEATKAGLIPDNTDPILREVYNYDSNAYGTMTGEHAIRDAVNYQQTYSSYTYRFFVSDDTNYSITDFNVCVENGSTKYQAKEKNTNVKE